MQLAFIIDHNNDNDNNDDDGNDNVDDDDDACFVYVINFPGRCSHCRN